ncbi:MAG: formyltetrahydrofolate deformylase [Candidatus Omnitrophica bacterium]|nr:formyltetrahydrofolate deformylase [Candidatus Omnitrophota bacterium]MDE2008890.1 formyltetrahydrofolate deformylase [Candidatus Omnitrophota bacterium]MDE2213547.1 formyltetrahydrofolate deformylase [Candidatus Omnitrophota bacterium]MDE2230552.1 formyltetrahydrofolate deformylase [Candidatus Omnitrophota bacterium]
MNHAILLISCPDQKGITAAVTNFVFQHQGNIVHADQHIDEQSNTFFMRIEWSLEGFKLERNDVHPAFSAIAETFKMDWRLSFSDQKLRVAVFVSKHLHCLYDLLYRHKTGQLFCEIPLIISNHPDARTPARDFHIPFFEFHVERANKTGQEQKQKQMLKANKIDLVVLARYHQIFTGQFVDSYPSQIINIHHSFLPAFAGSNPYLQAYQKGVKVIGATSHYVTEGLDEGPIIAQDTVAVSHRDSLEDLKRKGEDLEKLVLSRAVRRHLEQKILCYGNKTVVFD